MIASSLITKHGETEGDDIRWANKLRQLHVVRDKRAWVRGLLLNTLLATAVAAAAAITDFDLDSFLQVQTNVPTPSSLCSRGGIVFRGYHMILSILSIKWNLVVRGSWFVVRGRRFLCTYTTVL